MEEDYSNSYQEDDFLGSSVDWEEAEKKLLEIAFSLIFDDSVCSATDLAESLVECYPKEVVDYFGGNPLDVVAEVKDFVDYKEYEDEVTGNCLTLKEWCDYLDGPNAKELYRIAAGYKKKLDEKEQEALSLMKSESGSSSVARDVAIAQAKERIISRAFSYILDGDGLSFREITLNVMRDCYKDILVCFPVDEKDVFDDVSDFLGEAEYREETTGDCMTLGEWHGYLLGGNAAEIYQRLIDSKEKQTEAELAIIKVKDAVAKV